MIWKTLKLFAIAGPLSNVGGRRDKRARAASDLSAASDTDKLSSPAAMPGKEFTRGSRAPDLILDHPWRVALRRQLPVAMDTRTEARRKRFGDQRQSLKQDWRDDGFRQCLGDMGVRHLMLDRRRKAGDRLIALQSETGAERIVGDQRPAMLVSVRLTCKPAVEVNFVCSSAINRAAASPPNAKACRSCRLSRSARTRRGFAHKTLTSLPGGARRAAF